MKMITRTKPASMPFYGTTKRKSAPISLLIFYSHVRMVVGLVADGPDSV